jgi:hypothetical protein
MSNQQNKNETKERMINVEVNVVCSNCDGHGATCDNGCSVGDPNCEHRKKDRCNCDMSEGMSTKGIWIPESVITEWRERQHEIEDGGNWDIIQDDDRVANEGNVHTWADVPAIEVGGN